VALRHHEKWDGSGYPDGLAGAAIPESARIVELADVFDALSMQRPYKEPWPIGKIVDYLQAGAGVHFDPELVLVFCSILPQLLVIQKSWADKASSRVGAQTVPA
jgi:putative two-component system response regulator